VPAENHEDGNTPQTIERVDVREAPRFHSPECALSVRSRRPTKGSR
jgi:hypothetical protein